MPKKWIILVAIVLVIIIVGALLATIKPPKLSLTIKDIRRLDDKTINLTLTYTTKDINITSEDYRVKIVARRIIGTAETETKKQLLERPLPNVSPESSADQVFSLDVSGGYTDLNIYILKGNKQIIFQTQRIPIA